MFSDAHRTQQIQSNYNMSNQQLSTTDQQLDLGIITSKDLKGKNKPSKAAKESPEYSGSLPAISSTCISNMQYNSGPHSEDETQDKIEMTQI